ncbi:MAG TPA: ATP-binding protein, partial [Chloroflexota bacterium]|nr:ATP-binding protein [Chloroflexota bacterium]
INPAFERVTGYTLDEIKDRPAHYTVHYKYPDGRPYPMEECPIDSAYPIMQPVPYGEEVFVRKDGTVFPVAFAVAPLERDGQNVGAVVEFRDITQQKEAEEERERLLALEQQARIMAEAASRLRDEFLTVAAHELKTPMTSLRGYAQVTLRRLEREGTLTPERVRTTLKAIDQQTLRLARLVEQLLDVSRIASGRLALQRQHIDVVGLVRAEMDGAQARTDQHTLVLSVSDQPLLAWVDPLRLEQVLANLLDNAIKYSPEGGLIEVAVSRQDERVQIAVRDRGLGIPAEQRAHIFDRFYQAHADQHRSGLGLGLFIAKQIVDLHGGTITAAFPEGGGSRFTVSLPLSCSGARSGGHYPTGSRS